jgi:hypothetical protein
MASNKRHQLKQTSCGAQQGTTPNELLLLGMTPNQLRMRPLDSLLTRTTHGISELAAKPVTLTTPCRMPQDAAATLRQLPAHSQQRSTTQPSQQNIPQRDCYSATTNSLFVITRCAAPQALHLH